MLLGIDIGGTKAVVALARATGEILAESRLDDWSSGSWERDIEKLEAHARVLLRGVGVDPAELYALGLSAPGPLNPVTGTIMEAPNLPGWKDVPLVERFFAAFGVQALLENDANAAALAEWRYGAGQGTRNMVYLTMSTGVGAGLILDGRLYRGARFEAGEVGHMPIVRGGRACACGLYGCLEAYTGGNALAEHIREDARAGAAKAILALADGDIAKITTKHWVEAIRAGDAYACLLRDEFLDVLAQALAILILGLNPESIVLGTIIQANPDLFLDMLRERVSERIWPSLRDVRIDPSELGERLPAYAALSVASLEPTDFGS